MTTADRRQRAAVSKSHVADSRQRAARRERETTTYRGHVLTPQFLLESVWGYALAEYNDSHTVTVHLSSLRRKLGPRLSQRIVTVPGSGYRFEI